MTAHTARHKPGPTRLGERMYELRIKADLTQIMLEYRTGTHFTHWSRYERGKSIPHEETILKFAIACELDTETYEELLELRAEALDCGCDRINGKVHQPTCKRARQGKIMPHDF